MSAILYFSNILLELFYQLRSYRNSDDSPVPEADLEDFDEPLLLAIPRLITLLLADIPKAFVMGENGIHRSELPIVPRTAIRELLLKT